MPTDTIQVCVRVRPFNKREQELKSECVVGMEDEQVTEIRDPKTNKVKRFTFDHSFWSHDAGDGGPPHADQSRVFQQVGQRVLDNAIAGFNCCIFAYGQTGSGKSYSIFGSPNDPGIIPLTCEELFRRRETDATMQIMLSMLEVYNEKVRDLLPSREDSGKELKIRERPSGKGKAKQIYVAGLKSYTVGAYKEIEELLNIAMKNRTIGETKMNATSSRAHTILTLKVQREEAVEGGSKKIISSEINLIDLAGSERSKKTGAEGERLAEGASINKSLMVLGRLMSALAEGKRGSLPYRDSQLTRLLETVLPYKGSNLGPKRIAAASG